MCVEGEQDCRPSTHVISLRWDCCAMALRGKRSAAESSQRTLDPLLQPASRGLIRTCDTESRDYRV